MAGRARDDEVHTILSIKMNTFSFHTETLPCLIHWSAWTVVRNFKDLGGESVNLICLLTLFSLSLLLLVSRSKLGATPVSTGCANLANLNLCLSLQEQTLSLRCMLKYSNTQRHTDMNHKQTRMFVGTANTDDKTIWQWHM